MTAPGTSWQVMLADLSILLFLTSLSALAQVKSAPAAPAALAPVAPSVAEPVAIWRAGGGAPRLGEWLKTQASDARMQINVHAGYRPQAREQVLRDAVAISSDPDLEGRRVRVILEPAPTDFVTVTLSYDRT